MARILSLLSCLLTTCFLQAQTYFHIEQIAVVPAQPTTSDNVEVHLIGQLSDTGVEVTVASVGVAGSNVDITVLAGSSGGATVLVPHTEVVQLGPLPAGTYIINFTDASIGIHDMAQPGEHMFTVTGTGFPCDELQIGVQWHAFSDTAIVVHAMHNTVEVFDYPNFILFDAQGDTLAIETVNFFGIAQDSWHILRVVDGATIPDAFTGTLELWTGFTSTLACSWDHTFELCPPPSCATLLPTIMNTGGALVLGTFNYVIQDMQGDEVAAGSWVLTNELQGDADTLCLPPGHYSMQVFPQQGPTGGHAVFSVAVPGWITGPSSVVYQPIPNTMFFDFFAPCADIGQSITEAKPDVLRAVPAQGGLWVYRTDQRPLGELWLFDVQGRVLFQGTGMTDRVFVPLTTTGVHLLRADGHSLKVAAGME